MSLPGRPALRDDALQSCDLAAGLVTLLDGKGQSLTQHRYQLLRQAVTLGRPLVDDGDGGSDGGDEHRADCRNENRQGTAHASGGLGGRHSAGDEHVVLLGRRSHAIAMEPMVMPAVTTTGTHTPLRMRKTRPVAFSSKVPLP